MILVPLRNSFQIFWRAPPPLPSSKYGSPTPLPPPPPLGCCCLNKITHIENDGWLSQVSLVELTWLTFSQAKVSDESVFKIMYEENYFHTFTSHKYFKTRRHDLFLGIKQNGHSKSPKLTSPGQMSVQFILLPNNNTVEKVRLMSSAKQNRVKQGRRELEMGWDSSANKIVK